MDRAKMILEVMQLVLQAVEDMRRLSDSLQKVCETVMDGMSEKEAPKAITKKEAPEITLEKVRGVLAQRRQEGYTAEVKALIQKYGAERPGEVDPKNFQALLKDAEGLGNG